MGHALFPDLVVNGETVPQMAIAAEAQNQRAPKGKPGIAWRKAGQALAVRALMLQEARRRGLTPAPADLGTGRHETDEEALIRGLLEIAVTVAPPCEEAVRAEWARDPSRFRAPPLWEVSHILVACNPQDEAGRKAALARGLDLISPALNNSRGFARAAHAHSDCGSGTAGGVLGQLGPGETVPEFEAALRSLGEGEVTPEPVLTRHGWHIIRMDARAEGVILPFDTVRQAVSDALEKAAWVKAAKEFADELVSSATICGVEMGPIRSI